MFRPLVSRDECLHRLQLIFPRAAFDSALANPIAACAVAAMIYVDAVIKDDASFDDLVTCARPTTCLWMSDEAFAHAGTEERKAWRDAARVSKKSVAALLKSWSHPHEPWYGDNSRETLRDETFPRWMEYGAIRANPSVTTTSSRPRWALTASFADLFDPTLRDHQLSTAVAEWQDHHMQPGDRIRIRIANERERRIHAVTVNLPSGEIRTLAPGEASQIIKAVVEEWAPSRLDDPVVLTISEPGDKIYLADAATLTSLGLTIDTSKLLPDALLVDIGCRPAVFWIIEAVASDGPVDEDRKRALLRWAHSQRIPEESCRFLSAFISRNSQAARRRLKDLAAGTFAFYADEPGRELAWYELSIERPTTTNANVVEIGRRPRRTGE